MQSFYTFLKHDGSMHPPTHTGHLHQKYARYKAEWFPIGNRLYAQPSKPIARATPSKTPADKKKKVVVRKCRLAEILFQFLLNKP